MELGQGMGRSALEENESFHSTESSWGTMFFKCIDKLKQVQRRCDKDEEQIQRRCDENDEVPGN